MITYTVKIRVSAFALKEEMAGIHTRNVSLSASLCAFYNERKVKAL